MPADSSQPARRYRRVVLKLSGLALVVGIIATLLAGTVQGLSSYVATMKTTDSKLSELQMAEKLRASVAHLVAPCDPEKNEPADEPERRGDHRGFGAGCGRLGGSGGDLRAAGGGCFALVGDGDRDDWEGSRVRGATGFGGLSVAVNWAD